MDFKPDTDRKPDILPKSKNTTYLKGVTHPRISFAGEMLRDLPIVFKYVLRKTEPEALESLNNRKL